MTSPGSLQSLHRAQLVRAQRAIAVVVEVDQQLFGGEAWPRAEQDWEDWEDSDRLGPVVGTAKGAQQKAMATQKHYSEGLGDLNQLKKGGIEREIQQKKAGIEVNTGNDTTCGEATNKNEAMH